jgi:phospholipid/cholesterol/gamma-HCH transport system substrate-binding protein
MAKPYKFRYVNEIVGTFVLIIVLLVAVGIILAGRAQDWFVPRYSLGLEFPPEGSLGLRKGSEVEILGTTVGKIERISVHEDGSMRGEVTIKGDFIQFIREDSLAIAKKKFGVAGDAFVEITKGKGNPLTDEQDLMLLKDTELLEIAQNLLTQFQDAVLPLIEQIRMAAEEYTNLAADLRATNGPMVKLLANLEQLTAGLEQGEGSAGKLLKDPQLADELNRILAQVNDVMADVKKTTEQLPAVAEKVGGEASDLPGLMLQTQETMREAERLIDGIQKSWLVRGYIEQPQTGRLIKPSEVSAP